MAREQDVIHLPHQYFDYKDPESMAAAIYRNFREVERQLALLQSYVKRMTGGAVYDLPSDGMTLVTKDGLRVYDDQDNLRAHVGQYAKGKYGAKFVAEDGSTVLLDSEGTLQTWQEGRADNVDSTHPLVLNVYLPPETLSIKKALLRFKLLAFRAYETGAASGGGHTSGPSSATTTGSSSETTTATADENIEITGYVFLSGALVDNTTTEEADADSHNHGIADGTVLATADGGSVTYCAFYGSGHAHWLYNHGHYYTAYGHDHGMNHYHGMDHTHQVYNHTHPIAYGIYESTIPADVTVKINGVDRTSELGGPFNSAQSNLSIAAYFTLGQWNTIELGSSQLGRIDATVFIQALMGV